MERVWIIASVLALGVAAVLLLTEHYNAAFVAGALGAVAWFLNYRARIRPAIPAGEETDEDEDDDEADAGDTSGDDDEK
ncbi:MAG TPA: hypothetical protein VN256_22705 [Pyrinomonadaceae bacterium]|nr:hypothetical protein [Pyrinomonadaceae bacterium]